MALQPAPRGDASDDGLLAHVAHGFDERIKEQVTQMRRNWVLLSGNLYEFSEQNMWAHLGYQSFEEWLASPEIDLSRTQVFQLIANWRELVVNMGTDPLRLQTLEPTKVREILPAVRRRQVSVEEALADCEALSTSDLRQRYAEAPDTSTGYDATTEPSFAICTSCGSRYKVRP